MGKQSGKVIFGEEIIEFDGQPVVFVTTTMPITPDNLPQGLQWEEDGACWKAAIDPFEPAGWCWMPMNGKALRKEKPVGKMHDFALPPSIAQSSAAAHE